MPDENRDPEIGEAVRRLLVPEHDRDVIAVVVGEAEHRRPFRALRPRRLGARRLSLLVAAVVVVASASAALALVTTRRHHGGSGSGSSCALAIRFNGVDYLGATMKQRLRLGRALGQATVPPCPDFNNPKAPPAPGGGVDVVAIAGVAPSVAVGAAGDPHTAYVALGYFPELPSYPLHEGPGRDYTSGCRVTGTFNLTGTVSQHGSSLLIHVNQRSGSLEAEPGSTIQLLVDARTQVDGFDRNGLPYVTAGDNVRSTGVTCQFRGATSPAVVARTIAPGT